MLTNLAKARPAPALNLPREPFLCCSSVLSEWPQCPRGRAEAFSGGEGATDCLLCTSPLMHGPSQKAAAGSWPHNLAGEGLQGAMQQARLESDSSVVEIRNNAILQAELQSSSPYK